ncbi:MAG: hypothetical protein IPM22_03725 [Betaproteobacteria bacterium]|nr:hypothetical protein [Betaproteobacteria bacterium]MCC7218134.1 hypothetical protein [Burkholderiales bacterium]
MSIAPLLPKSEPLRRAILWLAEQGPWTAHLIDEACQRFDVDPADEEFLLREFKARQSPDAP